MKILIVEDDLSKKTKLIPVPTIEGNPKETNVNFVVDPKGAVWWVASNGETTQLSDNLFTDSMKKKVMESKVKKLKFKDGIIEITSTLGRKSHLGFSNPLETPKDALCSTWDINEKSIPYGTPKEKYPQNLFGDVEWSLKGGAKHNALLRRVLPNGERGLVWVGGANITIPIEPDKNYRVSVWVKLNEDKDIVYLGNLIKKEISVGEWHLLVGYMYSGEALQRGGSYVRGSMLSYSGVGAKDYRLDNKDKEVSLSFFSETGKAEFYNPIIERINEHTSSISDLLLCDQFLSKGEFFAQGLKTSTFLAKKRQPLKIETFVPLNNQDITLSLTATINGVSYLLSEDLGEKELIFTDFPKWENIEGDYWVTLEIKSSLPYESPSMKSSMVYRKCFERNSMPYIRVTEI